MQDNRFDLLAQAYDRDARTVVPRYDEMQQVIMEALPPAPHRVLDLGAGTGIFLEKLLERDPNTTAVWFDGSDKMEELARLRLQRFAGRVSFCRGTMAGPLPWPAGHFAAAVSTHAIHHLTHGEKQALNREVFRVLAPGGVFMNGDEVRAGSDALQLAYLRRWDAYMRSVWDQLSPGMQARWEDFCHRNIAEFGHYGGPQPDLWAPLESQLAWLRATGFQDVECHWKYYNHAVFGGRK